MGPFLAFTKQNYHRQFPRSGLSVSKCFEHSAIDIRASQGTPVRPRPPVWRGPKFVVWPVVIAYVLIVHTGNLSTLYGHLSRINVRRSVCKQGRNNGYSGGKPGTVGAEPFVTGPHLHSEVRLNGFRLTRWGTCSDNKPIIRRSEDPTPLI